MTDHLTVIFIGLVVFSTFTLEGISGFGSTVLALPFITLLLGLDRAVPLLSTLGLVLAFFIVIRNFRMVGWRELRFIFMCVLPGVVIGLLMASRLPQKILIVILTLFMLAVGVSGLISTLRHSGQRRIKNGMNKSENFLSGFLLLCGGVMQGAFSSGGPLVVIYAAKALNEKSKFRATLSSLWLTTNLTMLIKWSFDGMIWNMQFGRVWFCALPFVIAGIYVGNYLHHKVSEYLFRLIVYSALNVSAIVMFSRVVFK